MKTFASIIILIVLFSCSKTKTNEVNTEPSAQTASKADDVYVIDAQSEPDTLKGSLNARATGSIGSLNIAIAYHSPAVRGRMVWGGLIPFDQVWVTGAHRATSVEFNQDVEIGGVTIAAGKYALFTIPGKEKWTIVINKNWNQHLADDYDQKEDIVRVMVTPENEQTHQERLRYMVEAESDTSGEIVVYWEKLEISLPVIIKP